MFTTTREARSAQRIIRRTTRRLQEFFDHFLKGAPNRVDAEGIPYLQREKRRRNIGWRMRTASESRR